MCVYVCLQEVLKWQKIHKTVVPSHSRGRVYACIQCIPFIKERAYCRGLLSQSIVPINEDKEVSFAASGGEQEEGCPSKLCRVGNDSATTKDVDVYRRANKGRTDNQMSLDIVKPTEECMKETFNPDHDEWFLVSGKRVKPLKSDDDLYQGEAGRKTVKHFKGMIPMDLIYHMVHCPSSHRTPEYRMVTRLLRNLSGMSGMSATQTPGNLKCLYSVFPSIPMQTLVSQIRMGHIRLKGTTQTDAGTIADRIHLSGFVSGGKRRVARADSHLACVLRKCVAMLQLSQNTYQESSLTSAQWTEEQQIEALGGMSITDEEEDD